MLESSPEVPRTSLAPGRDARAVLLTGVGCTWAMVSVLPSGVACVWAYGVNWSSV